MKKRNTKHENRVKKLIVFCTLCGIILTVSTYAWFIGMKTVNVSAFEVEIAATESLALSLDGKNFGDSVTINGDNFDDATDTVYADHTNSWGGEGLIPKSTVGKIDSDTSKLIMFEKGSLTASPGGYRLMASRVKNTEGTEADGYVAFDLFVRNTSGTAYYTNYSEGNEEAIYLTPESEVTVGSGGVADTGIENSVRVAFAQIGRVQADSEQDVVTAITCATAGKVTGICAQRDATIWEPNDTKHVTAALSWYNTSCKGRTGDAIADTASYSGNCTSITDGQEAETYAVSGEILETDAVDVYDGFNNYTKTIATSAAAGKLVAVKTFTDTDKIKTGVNRPTFITLAPNSITKIRVYVYIEGQDIDNYDFASLGKQISVKFGFTKERFYGEDIDYTGNPELPEAVVRNEKVAYEATGEVTDVTTGVTYDDEAGEFSVPKRLKEFTFKDGGTTITYVNGADGWEVKSNE